MAKLINLDQLNMAMTRIKTYCNATYSGKDHNHDDRYYTESEIDDIKSSLKKYVLFHLVFLYCV